MQCIIDAATPFDDLDFEPGETSLSPDGKFSHLKWKRMSEIFEDPAIFKEGISPDDIY